MVGRKYFAAPVPSFPLSLIQTNRANAALCSTVLHISLYNTLNWITYSLSSISQQYFTLNCNLFVLYLKLYFSLQVLMQSNSRQWPSLGWNRGAAALWIGEWGNAWRWMQPCAQIHLHPKLFWSKHSEMGVGCNFEEGTFEDQKLRRRIYPIKQRQNIEYIFCIAMELLRKSSKADPIQMKSTQMSS